VPLPLIESAAMLSSFAFVTASAAISPVAITPDEPSIPSVVLAAAAVVSSSTVCMKLLTGYSLTALAAIGSPLASKAKN